MEEYWEENRMGFCGVRGLLASQRRGQGMTEGSLGSQADRVSKGENVVGS